MTIAELRTALREFERDYPGAGEWPVAIFKLPSEGARTIPLEGAVLFLNPIYKRLEIEA